MKKAHAWAAVNHKLDYKSADEAPRELERRLYRLSALFELADEQFSQIRDASSQIEVEYQNEVRVGNFDIPLNALSLAAYLNFHPRIESIREIVLARGVELFGNMESDAFALQARRRFLVLLEDVGISSLAELDLLIHEEVIPIWGEIPELITFSNTVSIEEILALNIMMIRETDGKQFHRMFGARQWPIFRDAKTKYLKKKNLDSIVKNSGNR